MLDNKLLTDEIEPFTVSDSVQHSAIAKQLWFGLDVKSEFLVYICNMVIALQPSRLESDLNYLVNLVNPVYTKNKPRRMRRGFL